MEQTFFSKRGVLVSNTRLQVGDKTYAMANISSVRAVKKSTVATGVVLAVLGLVMLIVGLVFALGGSSDSSTGMGLLCCSGPGFLFALIGGLYAAFGSSATVAVTTNAGEVSAYRSGDIRFVGEIADAVRQAIIARG
jgi:hypothetical protein